MIPNYRVVTFCPNDLSDGFIRYLNSPSSTDDTKVNKDSIAMSVLDIFVESNLPFCGTVITWSNNEEDAVFAHIHTCEKLTKLECLSVNKSVTVEGNLFSYGNNFLGIHGIYPLAEFDQSEIDVEYQKISFLIQQEKMKTILDQLYMNVLDGAIADGNNPGFLACILANDNDVAQLKILEVFHLMTD